MSGHLQGITVLNLASVGPAARCARILADYGARIIKVGPTPRKGGVQIQPPFHTYSASRGMEQVQIDLKAEEGKAAFMKLAATADVVIESFRPGVVGRLGIDYEAINKINPRVIYCATSGFGQEGPRSQWAGHDVNYLAVGGFLGCTARGEHGVPPLPGGTIADSAGGGMHAVISVMAALVNREKTGQGEYLDVSIADGVLSFMALYVDQYLATDHEVGPETAMLTGRYACYNTYATKDGGGLSVGAIEPAFWKNLCELTGLEKWLAHQTDDEVRGQVIADFREVFLTKTRDEWSELLADKNTCVAPILSMSEVATDQGYAARNAFVEAKHPEKGVFQQVGPVLAGGDRSVRNYDVPDLAVTDTDQIFTEAGMSPEEVSRLRESGVLN
jgi:alpha-methylacyl-CoA racemase